MEPFPSPVLLLPYLGFFAILGVMVAQLVTAAATPLTQFVSKKQCQVYLFFIFTVIVIFFKSRWQPVRPWPEHFSSIRVATVTATEPV